MNNLEGVVYLNPWDQRRLPRPMILHWMIYPLKKSLENCQDIGWVCGGETGVGVRDHDD